MLGSKFVYAVILLSAMVSWGSARAATEVPTLAADTCTEIPANAGDRVALVIGNSAYTGGIPALRNPGNDAAGVVRALSGLGFSIFALVDGTADTMRDCAARAKAATPRDGVALVYYSGHGIQIDDRNYMIATDAGTDGKLSDADAYVYIDDVIDGAKEKAASVLVFLDACRNNPFAPEGAEGLSVSTGRGLQRAAATSNGGDDKARQQARGIFVAYSTSPNAVATDGAGDMSPFTEAFVQKISKPGYSVQRALSEVSKSVGEATDWSQTPWIKSSLTAEILLNGGLTEDEAVTLSEKQAGESYRLLSTGDVPGAIEAALKGLPMPLPRDAPLRFGKAYNALVAATRSTSFRLGQMESGWSPTSFSPTGGRVAGFAWSGKPTLSLWDTVKATKVADLGTTTSDVRLFHEVFSGDGARIAAYFGDGQAIVADASTGDIVREISISNVNVNNSVQRLSLGHDGKYLLASLIDTGGRLHVSRLIIWNVETGRQIKELVMKDILKGVSTLQYGCGTVHAGVDLTASTVGFTCVLPSVNNSLPQGQFVTVFGKIDVQSGQLISLGRLAHPMQEGYGNFAFRTDANRMLAVHSSDGAYSRILLDTQAGSIVAEGLPAAGFLSSFSPDGSRFSSGGPDTAQFYSSETGEHVGGIGGGDGTYVASGAFDSNGQLLGYNMNADDVWWVQPNGTDLVAAALTRLQAFGVTFREAGGLAFKALD